jgi:hypothetical protein
MSTVWERKKKQVFFFPLVRCGWGHLGPTHVRRESDHAPDLMDVVSCRVLIERHAMRGIERTDPPVDAQQCPFKNDRI